jgi:hypothetical protein
MVIFFEYSLIYKDGVVQSINLSVYKKMTEGQCFEDILISTHLIFGGWFHSLVVGNIVNEEHVETR